MVVRLQVHAGRGVAVPLYEPCQNPDPAGALYRRVAGKNERGTGQACPALHPAARGAAPLLKTGSVHAGAMRKKRETGGRRQIGGWCTQPARRREKEPDPARAGALPAPGVLAGVPGTGGKGRGLACSSPGIREGVTSENQERLLSRHAMHTPLRRIKKTPTLRGLRPAAPAPGCPGAVRTDSGTAHRRHPPGVGREKGGSA